MFPVLRCSRSSAVPQVVRQIASLSHFPELGRDRLSDCAVCGARHPASWDDSPTSTAAGVLRTLRARGPCPSEQHSTCVTSSRRLESRGRVEHLRQFASARLDEARLLHRVGVAFSVMNKPRRGACADFLHVRQCEVSTLRGCDKFTYRHVYLSACRQIEK